MANFDTDGAPYDSASCKSYNPALLRFHDCVDLLTAIGMQLRVQLPAVAYIAAPIVFHAVMRVKCDAR